jgi:hypothetical protein
VDGELAGAGGMELLGYAVLENSEILAGEASLRVTALVRDHDVDPDDLDAHRRKDVGLRHLGPERGDEREDGDETEAAGPQRACFHGY